MNIPFELWHLDMMTLPPGQAAEVAGHIEALCRLGKEGLVRTIVEEHAEGVEVLGIAGVAPLESGVGEVFVVMAEGAPCIGFVKSVRQLLEHARVHFATIRALGDENDGKIERWLSWLGFVVVGAEVSPVSGKPMTLWRLA